MLDFVFEDVHNLRKMLLFIVVVHPNDFQIQRVRYHLANCLFADFQNQNQILLGQLHASDDHIQQVQ